MSEFNNTNFYDDTNYKESGKYYLYWTKAKYLEQHDLVKNSKATGSKNPDSSFLLKYKRKLSILRAIFFFLLVSISATLIGLIGYSYSHKMIYGIWPRKTFADDQLEEQAIAIAIALFVIILLVNFVLKLFALKDHKKAKSIFKKMDSEHYNPFFYKHFGFKFHFTPFSVFWSAVVAPVYLIENKMSAKRRLEVRANDKHRERFTPNPMFIFYPCNLALIRHPKLYFKAPIDFGIDAAIYMIENNIKR